jgi:hypothetical protein
MSQSERADYEAKMLAHLDHYATAEGSFVVGAETVAAARRVWESAKRAVGPALSLPSMTNTGDDGVFFRWSFGQAKASAEVSPGGRVDWEFYNEDDSVAWVRRADAPTPPRGMVRILRLIAYLKRRAGRPGVGQ